MRRYRRNPASALKLAEAALIEDAVLLTLGAVAVGAVAYLVYQQYQQSTSAAAQAAATKEVMGYTPPSNAPTTIPNPKRLLWCQPARSVAPAGTDSFKRSALHTRLWRQRGPAGLRVYGVRMSAPKFVLRGHLDDDVYDTFVSMSTAWIGSHRDQPDVEAQALGKAALAAATRGKTSTVYTLSSPDVVNALDDTLSYYAVSGTGRPRRGSSQSKKSGS